MNRTETVMTETEIDDVLDFAGRQLLRAAREVGAGDRFPRFTGPDGVWVTVDSHQWSSGFFAGCLWYLWEHTGDDRFRVQAEKWTAGMEKEKFNRENHNNGFMMLTSFGNAWRLTGKEEYRAVLIESARSLASLYNPGLNLIKAMDGGQNWKFPVIVDTMVNLELLFWAAKNGGDPLWRSLAEKHALRTARDHVRSDGSTCQLIDYDPGNGSIVKYDTLCGLSGKSAWARGQGQAIYGFAVAYRETGNPVFLHTARRLADFFISRLPPDKVPYWDFRDPGIPNVIRDSSAATVAAVGLLELIRQTGDSRERERYHTVAIEIIRSLCTPAYLAIDTPSRGILLHATWKKPSDPQADTSLIWGDYYFIETLMRIKHGLKSMEQL
jgi:unsaturated chondroitin disaccharide hydrolase